MYGVIYIDTRTIDNVPPQIDPEILSCDWCGEKVSEEETSYLRYCCAYSKKEMKGHICKDCQCAHDFIEASRG